MAAAAISAVFVDYKRIKGRKVHQVIFEVPSETWSETYGVLGEPSIEGSEWFGIAKLNGVPVQEAKGGPLAKKAALLCNEGAFKRFAEQSGYTDPVKFIYARCDVTSRAHLDHDDGAAKQFRELTLEYDAWRNVA